MPDHLGKAFLAEPIYATQLLNQIQYEIPFF